MACLWNQSRQGLDPFPGPFSTAHNCLTVTAANEVIFWNKKGVGVTSVLDLFARNLICKKFFFLSNM